ncbi:alcohol dehydrogenase catalytic domain-containing protein [Rhizobium tropici]|uniref:alcohol dehydrogenase catalytic domain-containing protein n=1 Tax=Rhizobium tropici TaxID=398 RepID=UPI0035E44C1F
MRAAFYDRQGFAKEVLAVGELPDPQPGAGEVRVRVVASGINPSDIKTRTGFGGKAMPFPRIVPHQDGAGVIDALRPGVPETRRRGLDLHGAMGPRVRNRGDPSCEMGGGVGGDDGEPRGAG